MADDRRVSVAISGLACTRKARRAARKHQVEVDMPTRGQRSDVRGRRHGSSR